MTILIEHVSIISTRQLNIFVPKGSCGNNPVKMIAQSAGAFRKVLGSNERRILPDRRPRRKQ